MTSEELFILASCCGSLMRRNSVLEELRVIRLAVIHKDSLKRMLKPINAGVENRWIEREEELCVIGIKVVVQGK